MVEGEDTTDNIAKAVTEAMKKLNIDTENESKGSTAAEKFNCPDCNAEVTAMIKYCPNCGTELEWEA